LEGCLGLDFFFSSDGTADLEDFLVFEGSSGDVSLVPSDFDFFNSDNALADFDLLCFDKVGLEELERGLDLERSLKLEGSLDLERCLDLERGLDLERSLNLDGSFDLEGSLDLERSLDLDFFFSSDRWEEVGCLLFG
jgi:hypothetical protein